MKLTADIPPVWLALAIALAWVQARLVPLGADLGPFVAEVLARVLIWGGVALVILAAIEFWRARTTIVPHHTPSHLITRGIFAYSRNPIYLADVLILAGFVLSFQAVYALILVPIFAWFIQTRFIYAEEDRMRAEFGAEFEAYEQKVRRWL